MNATIDACVALIRKASSSEEEQLVIADAVLKALSSKTHLNKLKEIAELIVCRTLNLRWVEDRMHGADAYDALNRAVELKTFAIDKGKTRNININYTCKKDRASTLEHYSKAEFAGGHYWVAMNDKKTEVLWHVYLSQATFLKIIANKETHRVKVNFGSNLCSVCWRCARVDRFAGIEPCEH